MASLKAARAFKTVVRVVSVYKINHTFTVYPLNLKATALRTTIATQFHFIFKLIPSCLNTHELKPFPNFKVTSVLIYPSILCKKFITAKFSH